MRISADPRDPAYSPDASRAIVFFNGRRIMRDCIAADEERGVVLVYLRKPGGHLVVKDGSLVSHEMSGHVRVVIPERIP